MMMSEIKVDEYQEVKISKRVQNKYKYQEVCRYGSNQQGEQLQVIISRYPPRHCVSVCMPVLELALKMVQVTERSQLKFDKDYGGPDFQ